MLFSYVVHLLDKIAQGTCTADDRVRVRVHMDKAICCFHLMLHAQGPIGSDHDALSEWRCDAAAVRESPLVSSKCATRVCH